MIAINIFNHTQLIFLIIQQH